jgi:hypothetical protein
MQRNAPVTSTLVIGLTLLALGSSITASKAGGPTGAEQAASSAALPSSNADQRNLSRHLKSIGAQFYGAWWCPACSKQKALFGQEAAAELPYIECDKQPGDRDMCMAADIKAFPTWELKGKERLVGVQSLEELKLWSGYKLPSTQTQP